MTKPPVISHDQLVRLLTGSSIIWSTRRYRGELKQLLGLSLERQKVVVFPEVPTEVADTFVVVGGGMLIDYAKYYVRGNYPTAKLLAAPTQWGSGAEVSPVVVLNEIDQKRIHVDSIFVPDFRYYFKNQSEKLPEDLKRAGCADSWAHVYEAFLSPIGNNDIRVAASVLMKQMLLTQPEQKGVAWFDHSADACFLQAQSSVGLIHGIAHEIEPLLTRENRELGHAELCKLLLYPVFVFNASKSDKFSDYCSEHGLSSDSIRSVFRDFYEPQHFQNLKPFILDHWDSIIKNPCSRTNSSRVGRRDSVFFETFNIE